MCLWTSRLTLPTSWTHSGSTFPLATRSPSSAPSSLWLLYRWHLTPRFLLNDNYSLRLKMFSDSFTVSHSLYHLYFLLQGLWQHIMMPMCVRVCSYNSVCLYMWVWNAVKVILNCTRGGIIRSHVALSTPPYISVRFSSLPFFSLFRTLLLAVGFTLLPKNDPCYFWK